MCADDARDMATEAECRTALALPPLPTPLTMAGIAKAFRARARTLHPDKCGGCAAWDELVACREALEANVRQKRRPLCFGRAALRFE